MRITWKCGYCGSIQESDSNKRHEMNYCKCQNSAMDLEEEYVRTIGEVIVLKGGKIV